MFVKWPLIHWQMRQVVYFNLLVGATAALYVLTRTEPFVSVWTYPSWFPVLHTLVIAWFLGRSTTPAAGYLHIQGFSRDTLWWHTVISGWICAAWAWGPAAILIFTGLRSAWQDLMQNPSFPYIGVAEHCCVWLALWEYAVCVPLGLYAAARWAHPARGNDGGLLCAAALMLLFLANLSSARPWFTHYALSEQWPLFIAGATSAVLALFVGRRLFRQREVQP